MYADIFEKCTWNVVQQRFGAENLSDFL